MSMMERKKTVELSARLKALTQMVTVGNRVCDVGCDHGFVSIYLVQAGISPGAIAMDVRSGPLSRAKEHIMQWELNDYIETRLSDGVEALRIGEADTLICAGMGGRLMMKILTEGDEKCRAFQELILQPQSEIMQFRVFLRDAGYIILEEDMVEEDGKYYFLMKAAPATKKGAGEMVVPPVYDQFGKDLLLRKHPVLLRYLKYRKNVVEGILGQLLTEKSDGARSRFTEMKRELSEIESALAFYQ